MFLEEVIQRLGGNRKVWPSKWRLFDGEIHFMHFPYCQKCHLHWLTFNLTICTVVHQCQNWKKENQKLKHLLIAICLLFQSCIMLKTIVCIGCSSAANQRVKVEALSCQLVQRRGRLQRCNKASPTNSTLGPQQPCVRIKGLPGVMNSRAAWTVAAPKKSRSKCFELDLKAGRWKVSPGMMRDSSSKIKFTSPGPDKKLKVDK